jgi:hypothetical protein
MNKIRVIRQIYIENVFESKPAYDLIKTCLKNRQPLYRFGATSLFAGPSGPVTFYSKNVNRFWVI